jgi:predicted alpha/beta hydrolase family esterase
MKAITTLLLPGWHNSGPDHWQSHWEWAYGYARVAQHDWQRPLRGDWLIQLEEAVLASEAPVVLVAHSLACVQVAAWAASSASVQRVQAALLVAPVDVERDDLRQQLPSWAPIVRQPLPFNTVVLASHNDPYCHHERAQALARSWGARYQDMGDLGHLHAESGLGDWPQGHAVLRSLQSGVQSLKAA